jgi:type VI secretion system protein ImpA
MASFDAFRLFGRPTPLDPPPDWSEIRQQSLDALRKTRDLHVLAHLAAALLRTDGIVPFLQSLGVAERWIEQWWAETYPRVDEDAIPRRSALNCLADPMAVIDGLRRLPLVQSRQHGTITLRGLDIAAGTLQPGEKDVRYDDAQIAAAFADTPLAELTDLGQALSSGIKSLNAITERMASEGGPEAIPAFEPLSAALAKGDRVVRAHLAARVGASDSGGGESGTEARVGGGTVPVGPIASRADAVAALDAVVEFFRRNEPASPVPLFVERARRLVGKDFLEVLEDIAPDGLAQARSAGGLPRVE